MNYTEFREAILEALQGIVPKNITAKPVAVEKLNSCMRHGIMFEHEGVNYAPTIYLEPFYKSFQKGYSVEELAEELYCCYIEETGDVPECVQLLQQYETAKEYIFCKLIHIEENRKLLEEVPHRVFLDFAIVAYFEVNGEQLYKGSVLIKNTYLSYWDVSEEALLEYAIKHTKEAKRTMLCHMTEVLDSFCGNEEKEFMSCSGQEMYVLTNTEKYWGAIQIYFPEALDAVREKIKEDFYLIPSSVHEWIVIPAAQIPERDLLFTMVREVNESEVLEEEVLSNNIYYYSVDLQKIYIYEHRIDKND